jgi:phosphonate transport system ATP-binding protein
MIEIAAPRTTIELPPLVVSSTSGHTALLAARDLWYSYDGRTYAVRGVDLTVRHGAMTMVLGRSGSGKTTLIKLLAGILTPQRGVIEAAARSPRGVAYIPQTLGLVRNMTALENTLAGALTRTNTLLSMFKVFPRETVRRAKETLAGLGLGDKLDEKVHHLSGGQRQRVAIARALMLEPVLILADEFVSQLDPVTTEEILDMMREITERGVGMLVTTHETDAVDRYADNIVVMRNGEVSHEAKAGELSEAAMVALLR